MKKTTKSLAAALCVCALPFFASCNKGQDHGHDHDHDDGHEHADGDDDHDHDHDHDHGPAKEAGPNGGRLLTEGEPHLEFLVTNDKKVKLTFLDENKKAVPVGDKKVSVTLGDRSNPTKLTFPEGADPLVSENTIPEGNDYPVVVQILASADAKPLFEKFNLNMEDCPTCDYLEYACTCDHAHDHGDE